MPNFSTLTEDTLAQHAQQRYLKHVTRRHFLKQCTTGLGAMALGSMMGCGPQDPSAQADAVLAQVAHFAPRAKRVIFLHMAGAPSQLELFDYKPELAKLHGLDCPPSLLEGKRFAFIEGVPKMLGPLASFGQHGETRTWVSDHLPHFQQVVDDVTFLKAVHTDEFNHAPAQFFLHTGSNRQGRPSMGSWVTYGLGSENDDLPGFVVLVSGASDPSAGKSVWGSGFLPSVYQGVQCRSHGDPVLYASNPDGITRDVRRDALNTINQINEETYNTFGDPETLTRIAQYELAFRMPSTTSATKAPNTQTAGASRLSALTASLCHMLSPSLPKYQRRTPGAIVKVPLEEGWHSYAQLLEEPEIAFFDVRTQANLSIKDIISQRVLFRLWVMKYAVSSKRWMKVGKAPISQVLKQPVPRYKVELGYPGQFLLYYPDGFEQTAVYEDCLGLECAAVWDPDHVEERLRDHYAGRPNRWVISLSPERHL